MVTFCRKETERLVLVGYKLGKSEENKTRSNKLDNDFMVLWE